MKRAGATLAAVLIGACAATTADSQPAPARSTGKAVTAAQVFEQMTAQMREEKAMWDRERDKMPAYQRKGMGTDKYDMLKVEVEDWTATPEAKYAHSIRIPNPVPEDSGYKPGMSQQQYFEQLCKNEAGEFIYKTVDNVQGIYQLRPRRTDYGTGELQHLYAMEDPYGHYTEENEHIGFEMVAPLKYSYFEIPLSGMRKYSDGWRDLMNASLFVPPPAEATIARYTYTGKGDQYDRRSVTLEFDTKPKSRYGYTWRGIKRPHDREMGIGGGELIVLDLETNEVMAVRRGYAIWNRGWTYRVCPRYGYFGGEDKGTHFTAWFVAQVVRPPRWKEYFRRLETMRKLPPGAKPFVD